LFSYNEGQATTQRVGKAVLRSLGRGWVTESRRGGKIFGEGQKKVRNEELGHATRAILGGFAKIAKSNYEAKKKTQVYFRMGEVKNEKDVKNKRHRIPDQKNKCKIENECVEKGKEVEGEKGSILYQTKKRGGIGTILGKVKVKEGNQGKASITPTVKEKHHKKWERSKSPQKHEFKSVG